MAVDTSIETTISLNVILCTFYSEADCFLTADVS